MMSIFWVDGLIRGGLEIRERQRERESVVEVHLGINMKWGHSIEIQEKKGSLAQLAERPPSSGESNPPRRGNKCTERRVV